jgi:hypothetical protein
MVDVDAFQAPVGVTSPVVLLPGSIELTTNELVVGRKGRLLARAPYKAVRARRTWLSLGSAVRIRVGEQTVKVDLSGESWRPRWILLEVLPPLLFVLRVRAGRRAAAQLLGALAARGADAR